MPQIKDGILNKYSDAKVKLFDPDQSIAKGAAIFARSKSLKEIGSSKLSMDVKNVLSKTFGVRVNYNGKDMISNLIYRNETLPIENVKVYYPMENGQTSVLIEIFEDSAQRSEGTPRTELADGTYVGAFDMNVPSDITMETPIKVKFKAADDGTIAAEVECLNEVKEYDLKSSLNISEEDVRRSQGLIEKKRV